MLLALANRHYLTTTVALPYLQATSAGVYHGPVAFRGIHKTCDAPAAFASLTRGKAFADKESGALRMFVLLGPSYTAAVCKRKFNHTRLRKMKLQ